MSRLVGCLVAAGVALGAAPSAPRPLAEKSTEEIVRSYTFVGDFSQHPEDRAVSGEVFWRYPYLVPKVEFPIKIDLDDPKVELPATRGDGRAVDHLNRGRVLYLEKNFAEAKNTWLGARARYGKDYPFHRRNDYFIGTAFMKIAEEDRKAKGLDWDIQEIKGNYSNAATFLSWAFIVKTDHPDPLVEAMTPKGLYNLAAIYWRYNRFAGAYGAADTGLNFLRKTGRKEYRPQFHRIVAESHIKNRSYLDAVRELDSAIRQDPTPTETAAAFARVGDIYFDLNNYELAEDAYALGAKVDEDQKQINPAQLVLRGESLFWLGRFSEAQKILHFALQGGMFRDAVTTLPPEYASWASLRIADAFLARKDIEAARLEYYKVGHQYRGTLASRLAKMRSACLELPYYGGNNIKHARELLEEAKVDADFPKSAQELSWACQVGSFTDRERTPEMLERVRDFAVAYPESGFLKSFVEPVREFQAGKIESFFNAGDVYNALSFFEKNRKNLYPKVPKDLSQQLFAAYSDVYNPAAAAEFWAAYGQTSDSDMKALRAATVAAELAAKSKDPAWKKRDKLLQSELAKRRWTLPPDRLAQAYVARLRLVPSADQHLPWMHDLAKHWGALDPDFLCDLEYPILSRETELGGARRTAAAARTDELIGKLLPDLFKHDESCALSFLELEAARLKSEPAHLAKRYVERRDWPLVGGFLHLYWTVAEHVYDAGDKTSARAMWQVLKEKGPAGSPEVGFAKARLDPTKTELERLWD